VVQDGHELKSITASGVSGCDGIAKSVKFELAATPFVIELSGTRKKLLNTESVVLYLPASLKV